MTGAREIYVVSGVGRDVTGLISLVTSIISDVNGNILDLEENVFHGLFSVFLSVDLTGASIGGPEFVAKMQAVAHQSGLRIAAEKQSLIPRPRARRMLRLHMLAPDHPGIVSAATFVLANEGVNIERAEMISRGDLFAMQMELDGGSSSRPIDDIVRGVASEMGKIRVSCFFQTEDIYRLRQRLLLFVIRDNLIPETQRMEIFSMAGSGPPDREVEADALVGLQADVVKSISASSRLDSDSEDLLYALKAMGYVIALVSGGFDLFLSALRDCQCVDRLCCGRLRVDGGVITGVDRTVAGGSREGKALVAEMAAGLGIQESDIITVGAGDDADVRIRDCGVHILLGKDLLSSMLSKKRISPSQIPAIVRAFGPAEP